MLPFTGLASLFHHHSGTQESICSPPLWEGSSPEGNGGMDFFLVRSSFTTAEQPLGRCVGMQTLASDLSAGLLSEEQDSQLCLLLLPCKEKEKWTMEKRKGKNQTFYLKN